MLTQNELNQILKGYIEAALWTEEEILATDYKSQYGDSEEEEYDDFEGEDELDKLVRLSANLNKKSFDSFKREDIEVNSLIKAYTDIKKFLELAGDSVNEAIEDNGLERLGQDIWLTRNDHGAGFFDHSYDPDNEKRLINAAKALGNVYLYINSNVKLSFSNEHIYENKKSMKKLIVKKLHEMVEETHNESNNYMFFNNLKTMHDAITALMEMDPQKIDAILSDGHGWALDHMATSADDIEEVYHFLNAQMDDDQDSYDGETEGGYMDEYGTVESININEAEYKGKKVTLGKPTRGDVKKYKVYVKNSKGNVIKVNFGDPNMEIKRDNPKRRKSFRARHKCSQAKDRTTPKYWSCKMWSKKPVSKIVGENFENNENLSIFKEKIMSQPTTQPVVKPDVKPTPKPTRRDAPFLPEVTPGIITDPKASKK